MIKISKLIIILVLICPCISLSMLIDNNNGTVTDTCTGLMWQKESSASSMTYEQAINYCDDKTLGGFSDWRLPEREELRSIVNYNTFEPAIDTTYFPNTKSLPYWSLTHLFTLPEGIWYISFYDGHDEFEGYDNDFTNLNSSLYVRAVRGGQSISSGKLLIGSLKQGEAIYRDDIKTITWDTQNISGNVRLSISRNGGKDGSFETIIESTENDGEYQWTVTGEESFNCVLKIIPLSNLEKGTSQGLFSILPPKPLIGIVTNSLNGKPIENVNVSISDTSTQTNILGKYDIIEDIDPGFHTVIFSKDGYNTRTIENVEILHGKSFELNIELTLPGPLGIGSLELPETEVNNIYSSQVRYSGGTPPYRFDISYGKLPPGISIIPESGLLTGIPKTSAAFTFFVRVTDGNNDFAERELTIIVAEELIITTKELSRGTCGIEYFQNIQATGGTQPYTFSLIAGNLPQGLSLSKIGKIGSSVPATTGKSTFTIQVTDTIGRTETKTFDLEIVEPIFITTNRLNDGIVGNNYDLTLLSTGGFGEHEHQWEIYSGILPNGLLLNNATISGNPTQPNYGAIVFAAKDIDGRVCFKDFTLHVSEPLEIVLSAFPNALKNEFYSESAPINGGIGPFTFDYQGLPPGINFNESTGIISGTPIAGGYDNVIITVSDSTYPKPQTITKKMGIRTTSTLTILTSAVLPRTKQGVEINPIILHAAGGPSPYQWQLLDGYLPGGITLDPETGKLSGTPIDRGDIVMTLQVEDANNQTAQKEFLWHICDTLTISTTVIPDAAEGIAYNVAMKAKGGIPPYSWRFKSGELPSGLSFNNSKGILQGTPTSRSTRTFTIEVNDNDTPAQLTEKTFTMEVLTDDLYIYTPDLPNCRVNTAYSTIIKAALGKPPYTWHIQSGQLPPGLTFNTTSDTATLEGTPTKPGTYEFTLKVSDSDSPEKEVSKTYTITIYGQLSFQTAALKNGVQHQAYSENIIVTGGKLPYIYRIIHGHLPTGLLLDPQTGHISGTLTGESEEFTVQVEDSGEPSGIVEKILAIYMTEGLIIVSEVLSDGMQHMYYQTSLTGQGGIMPYHWSILNGALPKCLNLLFSAGKIYGIPSTSGLFDITVQLSDASEPPKIATQQFQLNIHASSLLPGDINQDQLVDIKDAILLMGFIAEMSVTPLNGAVDINGDCVMGIPEVIYILQHIVMTLE